MMLAASVGWKLLAVEPANGEGTCEPCWKYAAMDAAVGQSRRQCNPAGSCDGYTRSWLRYATWTWLESTGEPTPCRFTNSSPPSWFDQRWMPPRDAQKDASTVCGFGSACVEQPLGPQFICAVTLKLPAASSQLSSYCVFGCAPAKNELASMPT